MAFQESIDPDSDPNENRIFAMIAEHIHTVRRAVVRRGTRKNAPLVHPSIENIHVPDGQDPIITIGEITERLIEIAASDAGDKTRKYTVIIFGTMPLQGQAPQLAQCFITVGEDDGKDSDDVSLVKAGTKLVQDLGDRQLRMIDATVTMIERISPLAATVDAADRERMKEDGAVKIKLAELAYQRDDRDREERESAMMQSTIMSLATQHKNLLDALASLLAAKATEITANLKKAAE